MDVDCIGGEWCRMALIQIIGNGYNYQIEPNRDVAYSPKYAP